MLSPSASIRAAKAMRSAAITAFLEIKNLSRCFAVKQGMFDPVPKMLQAVDNISFSLQKGKTLGLVGESGCGKSTLARMVARLLPPSSGDVILEGHSIWHHKTTANSLPQRIQMVFQDPISSLNPRRSIGKSIQEALDIHGVGNRKERRAQVENLLYRVGMRKDQFSRYPHEFSGGQRQRVAIARALVRNPEILICDEPVSALDVSVQAQVLNLFTSLQKQRNLTYLFISHDLAVVGHVSDRVAVMYLGKLVELADTHEIFSHPAHPYTQALIQAVPTPNPMQHSNRAYLSGDLPSPLSPPSGCPFHPRCPNSMPICAETTPEWTPITSTHAVACHLHTMY